MDAILIATATLNRGRLAERVLELRAARTDSDTWPGYHDTAALGAAGWWYGDARGHSLVTFPEAQAMLREADAVTWHRCIVRTNTGIDPRIVIGRPFSSGTTTRIEVSALSLKGVPDDRGTVELRFDLSDDANRARNDAAILERVELLRERFPNLPVYTNHPRLLGLDLDA